MKLHWLKKFCKGDESLEDEQHSGRQLEVDNNQLRRLSMLNLLQLHQKLPKNSMSILLWSFGIWSKLERWKSSLSGYLMNRPRKKNPLFWSVFSYCMQQQTMWWKVDFIWQPVITCSVVGPRRNSKALSKAKIAPKRGYGHSLGGLLPIWYTTAFWILCKETITSEKYAQQINEMHRNCNACSQHWPTEWAQFISITPDHTSQNQLFKSWKNWAKKFCLNSHITYHQPITTFSSISTTFCRQITSTTSMRQKTLSTSSSNPEGQIFMLQE